MSNEADEKHKKEIITFGLKKEIGEESDKIIAKFMNIPFPENS